MIEAGVNTWVNNWRAAAKIGATRVRIGWENPWPIADLAKTINEIHDAGMRLTICLTPNNRKYGEKDYVDFCIAVMKILKKGDILEVRNEPNHKPFALIPNAKAYAAEFVAVYEACKPINPDIPIIIGGMSPEAGDLDPRSFTVACINQAPTEMVIGKPVSKFLKADGQAMHTYCFPSDPTVGDAWNPVAYIGYNVGGQPSLDAIWKFCGIPAMPFYLTEFGAPSGRTDLGTTGKPDPEYPQMPYRYNQVGQAEWLARYLEAFRWNPANIVGADWFSIVDGIAGTGESWAPYMGLLKADGTKKEVTQVFRAWASSVGRV